MDPNEALRVIRAECHELAKMDAGGDDDPAFLLAIMLVEHVRNLDEWLSKGGFAPTAWLPKDGITFHRRIVDGHAVWSSEPLGPPDPAGVEMPEPEHDARPDDDPEPGDRCKDCGRRITWVGPSHLDWAHVPRDMDELIASDTEGLLD